MFGQFNKNYSIILIQSLVMVIHWFHSGHIQFAALFYIGEKVGFISLSRSVMNAIVNDVLWKYCYGVEAGVFARSCCRLP